RRAAFEAGDPAPCREPARARTARGAIRGGRRRARGRRGRRARLRAGTGRRRRRGSRLGHVVEEVGASRDGRGAVDEEDELVLSGVAELEDLAGLDDEDASPLELVALGRLAQVDRKRPVEYDEDLLLHLVRVTPPARARRIPPDVR